MNSKTVKLAIATIFLMFSFYFISRYNKNVPLPEPPTPKEAKKKVEIHIDDVEIVKNSHKDPKKLSNAIRRLAVFEKELIKSKARDYSTHPSELVRRAVMYALSFDYHADSFDLLVKGLQDKHQSVRLDALSSLSRRSEEKVGALMDIFLRKKNLALPEKIAAYKVKYLSLKFPQERKKYFGSFIVLAKNTEENQRYRVINAAANLSPKDPRLIKIMRSYAKTTKNHTLFNICFLNLAKIKDSWLIANLDKFLTSKNRNVRVSALNALAYSCPPNQWQKLTQTIAMEKDQHVTRAALRIPRIVGGVGAIRFLEDLSESKNLTLPGNLQQEVVRELALVKQSNKAICH